MCLERMVLLCVSIGWCNSSSIFSRQQVIFDVSRWERWSASSFRYWKKYSFGYGFSMKSEIVDWDERLIDTLCREVCSLHSCEISHRAWGIPLSYWKSRNTYGRNSSCWDIPQWAGWYRNQTSRLPVSNWDFPNWWCLLADAMSCNLSFDCTRIQSWSLKSFSLFGFCFLLCKSNNHSGFPITRITDYMTWFTAYNE